MTKQHRHEMVPTPKTSSMSFRLRFLYCFLELASRKNLEQLIHDAAKSCHGTVPPLISVFVALRSRYRDSVPFLVPSWRSQNLIWTDVPHEEGNMSSCSRCSSCS